MRIVPKDAPLTETMAIPGARRSPRHVVEGKDLDEVLAKSRVLTEQEAEAITEFLPQPPSPRAGRRPPRQARGRSDNRAPILGAGVGWSDLGSGTYELHVALMAAEGGGRFDVARPRGRRSLAAE